LDDKGLVAAATRYADEYTKAHGTRVDFVAARLDTPRLAPVIAATIYRILQEAMTNVARHAKATRVAVELTRDAEGVGILVRDNGVGFDLSRVREAPGLGLRGMRERVTLLGGSIQFQSTRKRGTSVRALIPVAPVKPRRRPARTTR
ncbi:MAG TPA: ATP-binding protein, partial [Gemmatimonadaceae bacterium]